jgi:hypothetical protein
MRPEWQDLFSRLERRLVRTIDVVSILVFDSVIIVGGYGLIRGLEALSGSSNPFFDAARHVSAAVFLLLYLTWVSQDLIGFWRGK